MTKPVGAQQGHRGRQPPLRRIPCNFVRKKANCGLSYDHESRLIPIYVVHGHLPFSRLRAPTVANGNVSLIDWSGRQVIVAGGAGFLGSNLVHRLAAQAPA